MPGGDKACSPRRCHPGGLNTTKDWSSTARMPFLFPTGHGFFLTDALRMQTQATLIDELARAPEVRATSDNYDASEAGGVGAGPPETIVT